MSDRNRLIRANLEDILYSIELILQRFENIRTSDDFIETPQGIEKLDSISMRLIAIGEGFKQIDKLTNNELLPNYPQIDWKGVKGVRDILSHHYFQLDAEVIFHICKENLPKLLHITKQILIENKNFHNEK